MPFHGAGLFVAHRSARRRSVARLTALSAVVVCLLYGTRASRAVEDAPKIRMAGVFNNWATSSDEFELSPRGGLYELCRFWRSGRYKFKFVFNGSWDRHLGSAGGDRLAQPGEDILLVVPQSGEYCIKLDPERKTWSSERRSPTRPHAIIDMAQSGAGEYLFNASNSIARDGKPLRFRWEAAADDLQKDDWRLSANGHEARLTLNKAGTLDIKLVVSDGEFEDAAVFRGELGDGCQLIAQSSSDSSSRLMHRIGPDLWAAEFKATQSGPEKFIVQTAGSKQGASPIKTPLEAGKKYLICYDATTGRIACDRTTGYAFIRFDPRNDDRIPSTMMIESVGAAGDFNNWDSVQTPLRRTPAGDYETLFTPMEGVHHYKIVVNGSVFLEDRNANAGLSESDGLGGRNSGVLVGDQGSDYGEARPNAVVAEALRHDAAKHDYFAPYTRSDAMVTLRTLAGDVEAVSLHTMGQAEPVPMFKFDSRLGFDYWRASLASSGENPKYLFELKDGDANNWFDAHALHNSKSEANSPFTPGMTMRFQTPDWAKKVVWYQIFPERFRNGSADNDPPRTVPWSQHWEKPYKPGKDVKKGSPADFEEKGAFWDYIFDRRYGGDLQGVRDKLGYLRDLGITAIYFNPIFQAESLHKYDASDYRHIDDFFGVKDSLKKIKGETTDPATWQWSDTDKIFLEFIQEAHRMGFKVIIDGVFNHVGRDFWAFKDVMKNGPRSEYAGWFDITSWEPFHYKAWDKDDGSLPRLRHDDKLGLVTPVREHLFAVTRRWMDPNGDGDPSDGVDGWRLDVAGDINEHFWKDWRKVVKSVNRDAYIVAELWEESRPWLDGRTFDAVMNYPFAVRTQRFFVNQAKATRPSEFDAELKQMLAWYQPQVNYVLQNLFDSHDTDRVASMFRNPDLEYDKANRLQDNGPNYNTAKPTPECYHKLKSMVTFQMTFLGAPMIYYGDEVGMYGADDPSDRKPMYWADLPQNDDPDERIVPDLLEHYRRVIAIRNSYPALQLGSIRTLEMRDDLGLYAFCRTLGGQSVVVVVNNSDKQHRLNIPSPWKDGAEIIRLDDPAQTELVMPPADQPEARPSVKAKEAGHSNLKVEEGRLHGLMLEPRTTAVFARPR